MVVVLGYIRPELNYVSKGSSPHPHLHSSPPYPMVFTHPTEALIEDINTDKKVALNSLNRPTYQTYLEDPFFNSGALPPSLGGVEKDRVGQSKLREEL